MADFDLSARITADASGLVQAGAQGEAALEGLGRGAKAAATGARETEVATEAANRAMQGTAGAAAGAARATTEKAQADVTAARASRDLSQASNDNAKALDRQGFAVRNVGQQVGDFGLSIAAGISPARAFAQQAGQLGFALGELQSGPLAKVGKFLTGPWGIALTVAAAVVVPFIEKLFEASTATQELVDKTAKTAEAADTLGAAQSYLGKVFDLTTGKIKSQNVVLIESIRLQAQAGILKAQQDQIAARGALRTAGNPGFLELLQQGLDPTTSAEDLSKAGNPRLNRIASQFAANPTDANLTKARKQIEALGLGAERSIDEVTKLLDLATAVSSEDTNRKALASLDTGRLAKDLRNPGRKKKPKKPRSTEARDEFGEDAADKLASLRDQFAGVPERVRAVNKQIADLDDLIDDLARKRPPGFEKLIADARALKPLVIDSLQKPYNDFVRDQREGLDVQRLVVAGREDEAEALKIITGLERDGPRLTLEQRDAVLATVEARRAENRELETSRRLAEKYVDAIGGLRGVVEDATQAFVRGDLGQLLKSPGQILDVFQQFEGRKLFDKLFDGAFQELEDQANGTSVVRDASDRMAAAVDKAAASIATLGAAAAGASGRLGGAGGSFIAGGGALTGLNLFNGVTGPNPDGTDAGGEVTVTAARRNPIAGAIGKLTTSVTGLFTNPAKAKQLGESIGRFSGKALAGAATGQFVSGVANSLGLKLNGTGAQLGGAIGKFLPIPGGDIIGSLVGGTIGKLFGKTKTGSASISNVGGVAAAGGATGNSTGYRKAASGLAGTVVDGINSVVEALGGSLGDFSVSIGQRKKKFVVDTNGSNRTKGSGTQSFDTAEEAAAAALANAIADGAVTGISAAMQRALQSSPDVERGVREALKVREVETLIGGLGSALKAQFQAFDRTAADRVRVARQYGLDVLAIEKINAEQRATLVDDTIKARIGSLSDFLQQVRFGDLFEGTAAERRTALIDEIAKVQADAEAGKDGAADRLAQLSQQLIQTSRDAFGTAGPEFTTDRTERITGVERVIQLETQRVREAAGLQQAAVDAIKEGNGIANEGVDLLAQLVASFGAMQSDLRAIAGGGGGGGTGQAVDYTAVLRAANN